MLPATGPTFHGVGADGCGHRSLEIAAAARPKLIIHVCMVPIVLREDGREFLVRHAFLRGRNRVLHKGFDKAKEAPAVGADAATTQEQPQKPAPAAPKPAAPVFRGWGVPTASGKSLAEAMAQKQ